AIQALESFLAYQSGAILLVDADNRFSVLALSRQGAPPEFAARDREFVKQHDPRVGKGITGTVAQTGQALRINDTTRDPRYIGLRDDVRSELCVPLKVGERVIGVLNVESPNENAYTEEDEQLLSTVASLLAVALENARLYARAKDDAEVKAALLRELSHRVKNNLTAVAGLLYLGLDKEKATHQEIFSETLARVQSMIAAHSLLSDSPRARVDLLLLGQNILSDSIRQLTLPSQKIPYHVEGESIEISARQATSLALVLNELVTNALKHAPPNAAPQLSLTVKRDAQRVVIELFNHGDLLAENFSGSASSGIGLSLIRTLVEKDLCGRFELIARAQPRGVASVITFVPES
ncbi:MAG: GAF domain-containing protein, partial [Chloroflexi bacterium]|nr:GAF domain-containing protein [Chloroflexota bacterium]